MEDKHRALEYEAIRREMTDRLLWVYGLLPVAAAAVYALLKELPSSIDPAQGSLAGGWPVVILALLISAFCIATHGILVNIYNSGSYLIVYHELELKTKHQYLLRSRFLPGLAKNTSFRRIPWFHFDLVSTGPTVAAFYLLVSVVGFVFLLLRFGLPSPNYDLPTFFDLLSLLVWLWSLLRLFDVRTAMEQQFVQYSDSAKIQDANYILDGLTKKHCPTIETSTSSPDLESKA